MPRAGCDRRLSSVTTTSNSHRCGMCWPLMPIFALTSCDAIRRRCSGAVDRGSAHGLDVVVTGRVLSRTGDRVPRTGARSFKRTAQAAISGTRINVRGSLHRGPPAASLGTRTATLAGKITRQLLVEARPLPGARPIPTKRIQLGSQGPLGRGQKHVDFCPWRISVSRLCVKRQRTFAYRF